VNALAETSTSVSVRATKDTVALEQDGKRKVWVVRCRPHIRMKLKRTMGKADRNEFDAVKFSDSPETCRDLHWFMLRYPMEMSRDDRRYLDERAIGHKKREVEVQSILAGTYQPRQFELAIPPRDYQSQVAELVLRSGGTLIADDLGVGKTVSAICTLTDPRTRPALVVTMTHLVGQWRNELAKFAPNLTTHVIKKGQPYDIAKAMRGRKRKDPGPSLPGVANDLPDVLIINYAKLSGWADALAGVVKSVIFDEGQELRIPDSNRYHAAKRIADLALFRTALTATPIYNFGGEMHSLLSCIQPEAIGTKIEFVREWCNEHGSHSAIKDPRAFGLYVRDEGLMVRRTRADVGRELPGLTIVPHHIDCDPDALDAIKDRAAELAHIILKQGGEFIEKGVAAREITHLMRQATGIAKAPYVAEFVKMIAAAGEKVVLYGWHHAVYDIWRERLKEYWPVMFTGNESAPEKDRSKDLFVNGHSRVLIMSLRAGAGLDGLQHCCRTLVHGELDWSPAVHEQADGRVNRDGQKDAVLSYRLLADSGSDPVVADTLGLKRAQLVGIKDPYGGIIERLETDGEHAKKLAQAHLERIGAKL
jgi:SNF2 family DNA or RNA helicase